MRDEKLYGMKVEVMLKDFKNLIISLVVITLCYFIADLLHLNDFSIIDFLIPAVSLFLAYFVVHLINKKHR